MVSSSRQSAPAKTRQPIKSRAVDKGGKAVDDKKDKVSKADKEAKGGKASDKKSRAPELNTWVTLAPEQRGKRAQQAAATPALVSAVQVEAGTAIVIYPCELVLRGGFKGSPLKRVAAVPFSRLRPATGSTRLHELLMMAVRAEAASSKIASSRAVEPEDEMDIGQDEIELPQVCGTSSEIGSIGQDDILNSNGETELPQVCGTKYEPQACRPDVPAVDTKSSSGSPGIEASCIEVASRSASSEPSLGAEAAAAPVDAEVAAAPAAAFQGRKQSQDVAPSTPHNDGHARNRSRSRSQGKCRSRRLEKATAVSATRAVSVVASRAFAGKDQITMAALLSALEGDASLQDARSQKSWDAMGAIRDLEEAQKVFVADELVFSLA